MLISIEAKVVVQSLTFTEILLLSLLSNPPSPSFLYKILSKIVKLSLDIPIIFHSTPTLISISLLISYSEPLCLSYQFLSCCRYATIQHMKACGRVLSFVLKHQKKPKQTQPKPTMLEKTGQSGELLFSGS